MWHFTFLLLIVLLLVASWMAWSGRLNNGTRESVNAKFSVGSPEYSVLKDASQSPGRPLPAQQEALAHMKMSKQSLVNNAQVKRLKGEEKDSVPLVSRVIVIRKGASKIKSTFGLPVTEIHTCNHALETNVEYMDLMTALFHVHQDRQNAIVILDEALPLSPDTLARLDVVEPLLGERWDMITLSKHDVVDTQRIATDVLHEKTTFKSVDRILKAEFCPNFAINWRFASRLLSILQSKVKDCQQDWSSVIQDAMTESVKQDLWISFPDVVTGYAKPLLHRRRMAVAIQLTGDNYRHWVQFSKFMFRYFAKMHQLDFHVWTNIKILEETVDGEPVTVHKLNKFLDFEQNVLASAETLTEYDDLFIWDPSIVPIVPVSHGELGLSRVFHGPGKIIGGSAIRVCQHLKEKTDAPPLQDNTVSNKAKIDDRTRFVVME